MLKVEYREIRRTGASQLGKHRYPGMRDLVAASELLKPYETHRMRAVPQALGSITRLTIAKSVLAR